MILGARRADKLASVADRFAANSAYWLMIGQGPHQGRDPGTIIRVRRCRRPGEQRRGNPRRRPADGSIRGTAARLGSQCIRVASGMAIAIATLKRVPGRCPTALKSPQRVLLARAFGRVCTRLSLGCSTLSAISQVTGVIGFAVHRMSARSSRLAVPPDRHTRSRDDASRRADEACPHDRRCFDR